jgi:predicted Ser/Thr protein kinase
MDNFKKISVSPGNIVKISNPTSYPLVGKGSQGAVFRLSDKVCVKIYAKEDVSRSEANAYMLAQDSAIMPKIYEIGRNYIIMEYFSFGSLEDYLRSRGRISEKMTSNLLSLLEEMKRLGFPRLDCPLRHIFMAKNGDLKVIDPVHALKMKKRRPTQLFKDLGSLKLLDMFAGHLRKLNSELYLEWEDAIARYLR